MAFEAKVTGGEKCAHCNGEWRWRPCGACRGHGRLPLTVDLRGYRGEAHQITNLPAHFVYLYDTIKCDPPDRRSPMIQALDGKGWRESLVIAHVLADETLWHDSRRPNFDFGYDLGPAKHLGDGMYESEVIWRKSEMIRLLDDPAWRESLKVAETPVEAEYAGVRERLEAMRPAPAGFYSARTGYEGEYRQFFGFRS